MSKWVILYICCLIISLLMSIGYVQLRKQEADGVLLRIEKLEQDLIRERMRVCSENVEDPEYMRCKKNG